jgi:hypothetical protein
VESGCWTCAVMMIPLISFSPLNYNLTLGEQLRYININRL